MAARSSDKGEGRYARSRDKWKRVLSESERDAEAIQQAVVALEAEQGKLRCKAELLSVIVEGLGVVIHHMMRVVDRNSTHLRRLQQLEHQIQQLIQQAGEDGSERSSSSGHELLYGNVNHTTKHYSTALLISWFQPEWMNKVLSMSDAAIVARLRELVGKSAILTLKGGVWEDAPSRLLSGLQVTASAAPPASDKWKQEQQQQQQQWWPQQATAHFGAVAAPAGQQWRDPSQPQQLQQHYEKLWQQHPLGSKAPCTNGCQAGCHHHCLQQQHSRGRLASVGSAAYSRSTSSGPPPSNGTSYSAAMHGTNGHVPFLPASAAVAADGTLPPPLEYVSILMTLMLLDEQRFMAIQFMNLDDMSHMGLMPPEFWAAIASKLELTPDQIEMLQCMSAFTEETLAPLFKSLSDTAQEGLEVTHKQEQQQLQQQLPQQQQKLLHAQASLLKRQHHTLQQWQIWGLQMGILSINTLTLHQMGLLQVFSYPNCPRMDMVLKDLATQSGHEGQQLLAQQTQQSI